MLGRTGTQLSGADADGLRATLSLALANLDAGGWDWDLRTGRVTLDERLCTLLGRDSSYSEIDAEEWSALVHPDDWGSTSIAHEQHLAGLTARYDCEHRQQRPDGVYAWVRTCGQVVCRDGEGFALRMVGFTQDVQARKATEAEAALVRGRFRAVLDGATEVAIIATDLRGVITIFNSGAERMLGYAAGEVVGSHTPEAFHCADEVRARAEQLSRQLGRPVSSSAGAIGVLVGEGANAGEWTLVRKDGTRTVVDLRVTPQKDPWGRVVGQVRTAIDISERKRAEEQLRRSALLDRLTDLPNRALLHDRLTQCIKRAARAPGYAFAVLFLDFDRFKIVNDSLGHEAGDDLLKQIAGRLRAMLRPADTVSHDQEGNTAARLGGDEFVVILDGLSSASDATIVAQRLLDGFREPYMLGDHEVVSTASIGIVTSDRAEGGADEILRDADTAMYEAKLAGKGCYVVFDQSMQEKVKSRLSLEADLRRALENRELFLAYQPIVSLEDGSTSSVEALVRWQHPTRGLIPPGEFISIAEETGQIIELGEWVLREACETFVRWRREMPSVAPRSVSVNLSRVQMALSDLPQRIARVVRDTGIEPRALRLEVTESEVMGTRGTAKGTLSSLKALGVELAMDDFGTGLSSLSTLHEMPFDVLKIDRSFIANLLRGRAFMALAQSIVSLAGNLGLKTVAEGIETQEQYAALMAIGCEYGQGYLCCKPLRAEALEAHWARGVRKAG